MFLLASSQYTATLNPFSSPNLLFTEINLFMYFEAFFSPFGSSWMAKVPQLGNLFNTLCSYLMAVAELTEQKAMASMQGHRQRGP